MTRRDEVRAVPKGERPEWARRAGAGILNGETLVPLYETERFGVVRFPGRKCWSGIGLPWSYAKSECRLVEKGKSLLDGTLLHEGRASAADLARMRAALAAAESAKEES